MEKVAAGISREWYFDRRVAVYAAESLNPHILIDWSKAIIESLKAWPADTDYLAIHDLSQTGMSLQFHVLTGYNILAPWLTLNSEQHLRHWLEKHPHLHIHLGVVVSGSLSGQITMRRAQGSMIDHKRVNSRLFISRDSALEWLSTRITGWSGTADE